MAQFLVKIADDRGHLAQQVEHGYSESEVRERFVQQGYLVYWVKPRGLFSGGQLQLSGRKVKQSQFVIFNQQFLTLIKAGLPILTSLDLLIKRQKDGNLKGLLQNVRERVKSGELLSDAFAAQGVFPRIYTTTLMAGEKSGNTEEVLGRYIAFQRLALTFKKKLAVSLVYPALLVTMVLAAQLVLCTLAAYAFARFRFPLSGVLFALMLVQLMITPDVLIVETFPFGRRVMRFELLPLLEAARAMRPKPLIACSVRDILQERGKPGRAEETVDTIGKYYDLVTVHGDPKFASFGETFPLADGLAKQISYTGLVSGPPPPSP